jgi:pyruvate/2-oxoglutarate dehydrogenase complex dihydrolipoamide dehydrogenase (E3) component
LKNIITLSTLEDSIQVAVLARGSSVVILGSSFIAMELAEALVPIAKHIHIISRAKAPYGVVLGETTGKVILQHFLECVRNVTFHCTDDVYAFQGNAKNEVETVVTMKKRVLPARVVVVAIGAVPNTEVFVSSPLKLHPIDRSILVNKVRHQVF